MNETRAAVGLPPVRELHGGLSRELVLVATLPQLEYPRRWPAHVRVTGSMEFELPYPDVELPSGGKPLVLVAPSTAQDPELQLLRTSLDALAAEPVRVIATTNRRDGGPLPEAPTNARVVEWLSYSQVMAQADLVVCHGGHGTVARALGAGTPLLCCPRGGDMAENGARVAWAGAGVMMPWRLLGPASLRWAVRRVLGDRRFAERAEQLASWARRSDGAERGAELVEKLADEGRGRSS
jgi:UDP:flavonoid glycosyltransferase YjiC (YdhE family)